MGVGSGKHIRRLSGGQIEGVMPSDLDVGDLVSLGHPVSPIKAIRKNCLECSGGSIVEARKCTVTSCPLWAFRMGRNPFFGKLNKVDEEDVENESQEKEAVE